MSVLVKKRRGQAVNVCLEGAKGFAETRPAHIGNCRCQCVLCQRRGGGERFEIRLRHFQKIGGTKCKGAQAGCCGMKRENRNVDDGPRAVFFRFARIERVKCVARHDADVGGLSGDFGQPLNGGAGGGFAGHRLFAQLRKLQQRGAKAIVFRFGILFN